MFKRVGWLVLCLFLCSFCKKAYAQQDVDFHINQHLLAGKTILKVKRDFSDIYVWVLAQNNEVYRVNSQTFAVDDYTAQFAAYSNLKFIDIAGHNQDTVYIAANAPEVIEYENGIVKSIDNNKGLLDTVNSIGIGSVYSNLLIGTTKALVQYNIQNETLQNYAYNGPNFGAVKVFSATYRTNLITNNNYSGDYYNGGDSTNYPIILYTAYDTYATYIYRNPVNDKINTAFYTTMINTGTYGGSSFWGNEAGLYQESLHWNDDYPTSFYSFLSGIKVNKITDILGLTSLYNPQSNPLITKDNLLVGTDNGLYFSSSLYNDNGNGVALFSLFHFDELGNIPVNDVCVNANVVIPYDIFSNCEDGVWLATPAGLYFIKPDYGKFLDPKFQTEAIYFNTPNSNSATNASICSGSAITMTVNPNHIYNNSIQWVKNGIDIPDSTGSNITVTDSGEYYAVLYAPCEGVHIETNHLKTNVISVPVFTFNYPDKLQYCDSASTTLNVTYSPAYHYRWYQDGALNGDTTSSLKAIQSGKYKVEVSACTNSWVPSKEVQINLFSVPDIGISINEIPYCQGDTAIFSSTVIVDTTLYNFRWYRDNVLLPEFNNKSVIKTVTPGYYTVTLTNDSTLCSKTSAIFQLVYVPPPTFTFNYPDVLNYCSGNNNTVLKVQGSDSYNYRWYKDGVLNGVTADSIIVTQTGLYKVEVTACRNSWVASKAVQVNFVQVPAPIITPDKPAHCLGDQATLSLNAPVNPSYNITWLRDGSPVDSYNNLAAITTSIPGNYTALISSNVINNCLQASLPLQVSFNPLPSVSILQNANATLCQGQGVALKAVYNGGTVKWSTGETSDQIIVNNTGTYKVTLTSPAGCMADTSITLSFLPDPVLNVSDTTICSYKNQSVLLTAPSGFAQYLWNNQFAGQSYTVTSAQTVNLTVTDANGCQATQQIHVTEQCPEVEIPNTFTPNGDGKNDTWIIDGISNDPTVSLKVFNRYGTLLYKSNGYATPWNGEYNGGKLSAGVYYYILTTKKGSKTYSGSVTILY